LLIPGKESTISGWGVVDDETLETSSVLKTATTKIKSNTDCKQYWRNIFDSNICDFSSTSYSTCQGMLQSLKYLKFNSPFCVPAKVTKLIGLKYNRILSPINLVTFADNFLPQR
jgi:hypothetical protein